jgi:hypothetical protein
LPVSLQDLRTGVELLLSVSHPNLESLNLLFRRKWADMRTRRMFRIRDLQLRAQLISEVIQPDGDGYDIGTRTGTSDMDVPLRTLYAPQAVTASAPSTLEYILRTAPYPDMYQPCSSLPSSHVCSGYMNAWRAAWRFQWYHCLLVPLNLSMYIVRNGHLQ